MIKKILHYTRVWYHLLLSSEKQNDIVWNHLKKYHITEKLNSGFFENEKRIESDFRITDDYQARFFYAVYKGTLYCRCKVIQDFDPELTTEMFVLATHFNNLLRFGKVMVDPTERSVEFAIDSALTEYIVYPGALQQITIMHYDTTKDIFWAFQKLINEQEEPAIIIADFLRKKQESDSTSKGDS
jgi:hypothetical protein